MPGCYNGAASHPVLALAIYARSRNAVALDIGSSSVKMLELEPDRAGRQRLKHFGIEALPPEAIVDGAVMNQSAVVSCVRNLLAKHKVKTREAVVAVSGNSVIIKRISLPLMTQEELDESIPWEAEQYIPFDVNDVNIDAYILQGQADEAGQMEVLLVAARKELVNEFTGIIQDAGLKPAVIDVAAFALENMYTLNYDVSAAPVALVNVGASTVNINVLRRGVSAFTRDLGVGGRSFTEEIQRTMNVSYEEAEAFKLAGDRSDTAAVVPEEVERVLSTVAGNIATEVHRSLDFYLSTAGGGELTRLYLAGGAAQTPGLREALEHTSGCAVEVVDPFRRVQVDERAFNPRFLKDVAPQAAIAVGLGLRRANDK